ncbi:hypothetical protein B4N89_41600 [Embleya scabrispora]|uniref:Uncharacterized protein n=2 Tax=Embleya scabrispora TaxID=159449 RepID=A0A1T3NK00_9ACTN|nr:hypothetical protein B4N89_41600 [Embleya scabrispora]
MAIACRLRRRLRFDHAGPRGGSLRSTEPHSAVHFGRYWYLGRPGMGVVEPLDEGNCLRAWAPPPRDPAWMITSVDADFILDEVSAEVRRVLQI